MKRTILLAISILAYVSCVVWADTFGEGLNQFEIDFVPILGSPTPAGGIPVGPDFTFTGVANDYRMGMYEITNDQWTRFKASIAPMQVTGSPSSAYDSEPYWMGTNIPTNMVSWYEAAQFVNWLNTSTGHQAAYKFTGTQGTGDYTFSIWNVTETDGTNLYRHKDVHYFLPTENEWVKAAYWNGTNIQTYATVNNAIPIKGVDTNYYNAIGNPWATTAGSVELNGTKNMMGNVRKWTESPFSGDFADSYRVVRGGTYSGGVYSVSVAYRYDLNPDIEVDNLGFRVASIPEPATLLLFGMGGLLIRKCK